MKKNIYKKGGGYFPTYNSWAPPRMDVGGPGNGLTPGPVVVPYANTNTTQTYTPSFMNMLTPYSGASVPSSDFNYDDYYGKANKYLSRPIFKGTTLSAKDIADAAQDFYKTNKYVYPLDLLLTQGQMESKLGKTLKSANNFFNIGNTDNGATRKFATPKDSVMNYMTTMYNDYLDKGKKSPDDLLKPKGFVNYAGARYASAADYEKALADQRAVIQKHLNKKNGGSIYKDGGLLSRTVTCSNCGWSWKSTDGGIDPMTCHKCGGMIKMRNGGDPSIADLDSGNWLMKYKDGGGGIGDFFKNLFGGGKGGRGSVACPSWGCGKFNDGTGGGGLHLGEFFSNVGHGIGEGAQAVGHFLGDVGSGIGDIFGSIGDGHRRRRKCFEKGMEWDEATKSCKPKKINNPTPSYGGNDSFISHSYGTPSGSYTPQPVDTTTTMVPGYGMVGPQQDNGIVWNYNPAMKAQSIQDPINPSPNIGGDLYETNKSFAMYGGPLKRFPGGGVTCGKGQVRFADENGERCIDINSQEYKNLYEKGIGTFQKYDKAQKKWVATTQDDTDAIFTTNKATLPNVTVVGKVNPAKRAEYLKKQQEQLIGPMGPNYNVSESTRNQPMIDLTNARNQEQQLINSWKSNNPNLASLSDQEVLTRINIQNTPQKEPATVRGLTDWEKQNWENDKEAEAWRKKWVPGAESEYEKTERWHKENKEHDEDVASVNSAILARDNGQAFALPTGKTKLWKDMDGREKAYVEGLARSRSLHVFPGATSDQPFKTAINSLNPFPILSGWYKGAMQSPYIARETNSVKPYFAAALDPAITIGAVMLGQPELTAGEALTGNLLNWKKPFQNIGKAIAASEEGALMEYGINKYRKDKIKEIGKGINSSLKSDVSATPTETQIAQLQNTPSGQGINSVGLTNPLNWMPASGFNLGSVPFVGQALANGVTGATNKKYGGSTRKMKNWTDKYK